MIDIETLRAFIAETGLTTQYASDLLTVDVSETLPSVYVSYGSIDSSMPNAPVSWGTIDYNGENLTQSFEVMIVCDIASFRSIWVQVYKKLTGWNPIEQEKVHSVMTYKRSGKIDGTKEHFRFVSEWMIGFPTNKTLM